VTGIYCPTQNLALKRVSSIVSVKMGHHKGRTRA
jgi:hypothetical protein